ncbi:Uncharacterised protein [Salmonella enterica subsp. enterica serovar Typhi]|nr:Uncharacterised protein [Salmonella enterica subsp. enterica serovar Typhi]CIH17480.1 Uncharacterised protein [Salmonella enterica subsp. enterica serovar Typhi]CWY13436.1 Uncharacterised protein [Salmonella enterica subsp. enterica serovar Typhi]
MPITTGSDWLLPQRNSTTSARTGKISEVSLWRVFTASQACVMWVSLVQVLIFWKE